MATYYGSYVGYYSDVKQRAELTVELSNGSINWSLKTTKSTGGAERGSLYNVTVSIGGRTVYGPSYISWQNYTLGSVLASGSVALSNVTISNGTVLCKAQLGVSASYDPHISYAQGNLAVASPTINALQHTETRTMLVSNIPRIIAGYSTITFTMGGQSQSGGTITQYDLYQNDVLIYSGAGNAYTIVAPSPGSYDYKYKVTDSNGTSSETATAVTLETHSYIPGQIAGTQAIRVDSNDDPSDEGGYARLSMDIVNATFDGVPMPMTAYFEVVGIGNDTKYAVITTPVVGHVGNDDISVDTTYKVIFKLYDSYGTIDEAIMAVDYISVGGRGIDLCYENGEYGVGVGYKATPGDFNIGLEPKLYRNGQLVPLIDVIYPVGSIYMSVNNVSPQTFFGGTWVAIEDKFLLAAGQTYSAGSTGGQHETILQPENYQKDSWLYNGTGDPSPTYPSALRIGYGQNYYGFLSENENDAIDNMPPYLAVYVWKRTA